MDALEITLIVTALAVGLAAIGFWLWMLIECVTRERGDGNERLVWLVVIVATKFVGALIYFFVRRPERLRLEEAVD